MSIYLSFDGGEPCDLASNRGWADVCRWIDSLRGKAPVLAHLRTYGWVEPAHRLRAELTAALRAAKPEGSVQRTLLDLLELLDGSDNEVVTINNGIGPEAVALDEGLADGVWGRLLEACLLETGFTGEKKSKSGARLCYQDGKRVPCPKAAKPEKAKKPTVDEAHQAIQARLATGKPLTKDEAGALATHISGLTGAQVTELKKKLGLKASGTKAEMARKLVAGAFAKLASGPAGDPKHAAAHAYLEKVLGAETLAKLDLNDHAAVSAALGKALAAGPNPPEPDKKPLPPEKKPPPPEPERTGPTPASPEPGFTGTDTLGRKWVNGKLVPGDEDPPANKAFKAFDTTKQVKGTNLVPGQQLPEKMPHPTTRAAIETWAIAWPSMRDEIQKKVADHYGFKMPPRATSTQARIVLEEFASNANNGDIAVRLREAKDVHALVARLSNIPDAKDLRKAAQAVWVERDIVQMDLYKHIGTKPEGRAPKEWNQKHRELETRVRELTEKYKQLDKQSTEITYNKADVVKKLLALAPDKASDVKFDPPDPTATVKPSAQSMESVKQGAEWLQGMVAKGEGGEHLPTFKTKLTDPRAHYNQGNHSINTGTGGEIRIVVHEMGHGIEAKMPGALEAAKAFLAYRTHGETPTRMKDVATRIYKNDAGYDDSEVGRKDNFDLVFGDSTAAYYCGKSYANATELLSMGVEQLFKDPSAFARKDPEYCAFVVGILHGRLRNKAVPNE